LNGIKPGSIDDGALDTCHLQTAWPTHIPTYGESVNLLEPPRPAGNRGRQILISSLGTNSYLLKLRQQMELIQRNPWRELERLREQTDPLWDEFLEKLTRMVIVPGCAKPVRRYREQRV
jgi:hypothetical protein